MREMRGDGDAGPNFRRGLSVSRGTQHRPRDAETVVCRFPIGGDRNPLVPHQPIEYIDRFLSPTWNRVVSQSKSNRGTAGQW